jgi:hypothetical protein
MSIATIYVGCGGSGLKTLQRVSHLLSEDPGQRSRMAQDHYFMVIDTDLQELNTFSKTLTGAFSNPSSRPYFDTIHLSRGTARLQPLVNQVLISPFENGQNPEGKDRLSKHWWQKNGNHFNGSAIAKSLTLGAGQCPPVSFFLTWYSAEYICERIEILIDEIAKRSGGMNDVQGLNLVLVTGLAGGTGRGSWNLIAYMFREIFRKRYPNLAPLPVAFLYDYSTFPNVTRNFPTQKIPMKINSLTGLSELSCWVKNRKQSVNNGADPYVYRLPSLKSPENHSADCVSADLQSNSGEAGPVDFVYLCFGETPYFRLDNSRDFFDVVGTGIYGLVAVDELERRSINSNFNYNSIGVISYEINASKLRLYFEARIRELYCERLLSPNQQHAKRTADELTTELNLSVDKILKQIEEKLQATSVISERLALIAAAASEEQDLDTVKSAIENYEKVDDVEVLIQQILTEMLESRRKTLKAILSEKLVNLLKKTFSLHAVRSTLEFLLADVESIAKTIDLSSKDSPLLSTNDSRTLSDIATEYSGRGMLGLAKPFENQEIESLIQIERGRILRTFRQPIAKYLDKMVESLETDIRSYLEIVIATCQAVSNLDREYERTVKSLSDNPDAIQSAADIWDELFADPKKPELSIPYINDDSKFGKRNIRPVYSREQETKDLAEQGGWDSQSELALKQPELLTWFKNLFNASEDTISPRQRVLSFEDDLQGLISGNVGIDSQFITERFSISNCLGSLLEAWNDRIASEKSEDRRNSLINQFELFFGVRPEHNGGTDWLNFRVDEVLAAMAFQISQIVTPYWLRNARINTGADVVNVFWNSKSADSALEKFQQLLATARNGRIVQPFVNEHKNPFVIVAVATSGVEKLSDLTSTEYYKHADVVNEIKKVESPEGELIFGTTNGSNGGLGLVDPIYVNDDKLKNLRWRPWTN